MKNLEPAAIVHYVQVCEIEQAFDRSRPPTGSKPGHRMHPTFNKPTLSLKAPLILMSLMVSMSVSGATSADTALEIVPADQVLNALRAAPHREGPPPITPDGIPHQQHNQNGPFDLQQLLTASVSLLPGIHVEPTQFSLDGALGWRLNRSFALGPVDAFIRESDEFGHLHRSSDGSAHMLLPVGASALALDKGWGIIHPLTDAISGDDSDYVMIYSARNDGELETFWTIVQISYYYARGTSMEPSTMVFPTTLGRIKSARR